MLRIYFYGLTLEFSSVYDEFMPGGSFTCPVGALLGVLYTCKRSLLWGGQPGYIWVSIYKFGWILNPGCKDCKDCKRSLHGCKCIKKKANVSEPLHFLYILYTLCIYYIIVIDIYLKIISISYKIHISEYIVYIIEYNTYYIPTIRY